MVAMIPDTDALRTVGQVLAVLLLIGLLVAVGLFGMAVVWTKDGGRHRG